MSGSNHPTTRPGGYADLDVTPITTYDANFSGGGYRISLPMKLLREEHIPIEPEGQPITFIVSRSDEVPGRIVLDLDHSQLPTPPQR